MPALNFDPSWNSIINHDIKKVIIDINSQSEREEKATQEIYFRKWGKRKISIKRPNPEV